MPVTVHALSLLAPIACKVGILSVLLFQVVQRMGADSKLFSGFTLRLRDLVRRVKSRLLDFSREYFIIGLSLKSPIANIFQRLSFLLRT